MTESEEKNRKFFFDVGAKQQHRSTRSANFVDCCSWKPKNSVRRQTIAELCIDVVGSENALKKFRPGVGVFIGQT